MNTISVVVPCYNGARDLPRCLESLLAQTVSVEIIVVNDGSTDQTAQIALDYESRYDNVHVITKENQGLPQARKTGLEAAKGTYVGFVDSDDFVQPNMYKALLETIEEKQAEIACCGVNYTYPDGKQTEQKQKLKHEMLLTNEQALHMLHCRVGVFPYMWNKLFRRDVFDGIVFPEGNFTGEDYVTVIQLLRNANKVAVVDDPLYNYMQNTESMSHGGFKPSHLLAYRNYEAAQGWLLREFPQMRQDMACYLSVEYISFVIAMSRNNKYDYVLVKEIQKYVRKALGAILRNRDMSLLYKGSALVFSVHHRLLTEVYRLVSR